MTEQTFKALIVTEEPEKTFNRTITERSIDDLPEGDVLVKVEYSSLNYKDALSATGNKGVTRNYPHTPGIDAAGIVESSAVDDFKQGDQVLVTSYDLGMNTSGGFSEYIRVPAGWVVKLPASLTFQEAMIYGTAGFTAGLSVSALTHIVKPEDGEVLVTGASGGVGSVAVAILSKLGFEVIAVGGLTDEVDYLKKIGAKEVINHEEFTDTSGRPLLKTRFAGAIDTVGGDILATAIKSLNYNGTVTCCGNAASMDLPLTVFPFILRSVRLLGIDSQNCPMDHRTAIWEHLAGDWKLDLASVMAKEITLDELEENIQAMLQGKNKGRTLIKLT